MDIICICSKIISSKTILAHRTCTFPQNKTRIFLSLLVSSCMKTKHTHAACNFHSQVYHGNLEQSSIRSHKIVAKHFFYCIFIPDGCYNTFNKQQLVFQYWLQVLQTALVLGKQAWGIHKTLFIWYRLKHSCKVTPPARNQSHWKPILLVGFTGLQICYSIGQNTQVTLIFNCFSKNLSPWQQYFQVLLS